MKNQNENDTHEILDNFWEQNFEQYQDEIQ